MPKSPVIDRRAAIPTLTWRGRALLALYSTLLRLASPFYLLRLWWRGRAEPAYRHAIAERFGFHRGARSRGWVWVHAVSLGETRAAAVLIDALRARRPGLRLLLTHGTATGRDAGAPLLRPGDMQTWLPVDTPGAVRRFFRHFSPAIGVLMETEIWPNLLLAAAAARVPMVSANTRLSERSRRRGARLDTVLRPIAASFARILAQTECDAARLTAAGARDVEVAGNLKFDVAPDAASIAQGRAWRAGLAGRPVLLAAVTRDGEEAMLLEAWTALPAPRPLLVVVPRHPQRFDAVAALIGAAGLTLARRSAWPGEPPPDAFAADVWLGDSMREMPLYYGFAQAALLGGSFAPLGGQNLIEAAACGCPVVMGPHTFNFADAAEGSLAAGASQRVPDMRSAVAVALAWLNAPDVLAAAAADAVDFSARHRGAARRMAARIEELLPLD